MNKICKFLLASTMTICMACNSSTEKTTETITVDLDNTIEYNELVSKIELVPLDFTEDAYMANVNRCTLNKDHYMFVDSKDIIYFFDKDGHLVSNSRKVFGNGSGEYNMCLCASYNTYSKCFEVVTPTGMKIYDRNFKYIRTTHFDKENEGNGRNKSFFKYIHDVDGKHQILMTSGIANTPFHMYLYNSAEGKTEKDKEPEGFFGITMQENCISDGDFLAMPWLSYTFYKIDPKSLDITEFVALDFGDNEVKKEDVEKFGNNEQQKAMFFMKCEKPLPLRTFKSGDQLVSVLKCGAKREDFKLLVANLSDKKAVVANTYNNKIKMPIANNFEDGVIYAYTTDMEIDQCIDERLLTDKSKEIKKGLARKGNTVIVKYYIKRNDN